MEHVQRYSSLKKVVQKRFFNIYIFCADPATIKSYLHKYMVEDWESITFMGEYITVLTFTFSIYH